MPQKGILVLNTSSIKMFKAKDRQAAQVLQEVGLNEIHWFKNEHAVNHYICPTENCDAFFLDVYLLKNHFFKTHNGRPFKCDFANCKWSFATKSKLERHKNSHLNLKWFKCVYESCNKMFTTMYNLRQHLKSVHEKAEQFMCSMKNCSATFHNQRSLDLHKVTHKNLGPSYSCEQEGCTKSFVTKNALCSHMRSHEHKLEDLKCSWEGCDKVFDLPCRLREHMRTHTGEKPFRCDHPGCGWSFYSGSKLHRHRNKHLQIRKFVCCVNHCNKSFLRSQHLKEHILTHSKNNSKLFACPIDNCNSSFGSKNLVYRHVKKVHKQKTHKSEGSNEMYTAFGIKITNNEIGQQDQPLNTQLESLNLLAGDYDVCSGENVPLTTQLPELVSSELLVAMTSIDSGNGDSVSDIAAIDSACNSQSLVVMTPIEANNNETLVINDTNVQYILESSQGSKHNNKKKSITNGAARTNYTYKDVMREKTCRAEYEERGKLKWLFPGETVSEEQKAKKWRTLVTSKQSDLQNCKMTIPPDLVLGAGISDHNSLIIKDELYSQEDLQVLLLDQTKVRNPIFEPSTVNLRDLE